MAEEKWQDTLPEALRDAPYLAKAESAEDAVAKLVHAAKLVGTSVRIPGADASEEDRAAFFAKLTEVDGVAQLPLSDDAEGLKSLMAKLGAPEDVAGYKLPELEDFKWDEAQGDNLRRYALEAGMTAKQFAAFATNVAKQEQETGITAETALSALRQGLRADWGEALDERTALIRGYLQLSDAPETLIAGFKDNKLPLETMNWLYEVAKQFKGDVTPISADGKSPTPTMTIQEAYEAIPVLLKDMTGMRETDPRYKGMQQKLVELHRLAKPGEAA